MTTRRMNVILVYFLEHKSRLSKTIRTMTPPMETAVMPTASMCLFRCWVLAELWIL